MKMKMKVKVTLKKAEEPAAAWATARPAMKQQRGPARVGRPMAPEIVTEIVAEVDSGS
jgi:hypothetical protein